MGKYSITQLATILVKKNGISNDEALKFVTAIFDIVKEGLETDKLVKIKGFGTFKIIDVDPRESVNVNTGERVLINGHQKITFTPDSVMKEMVNRPFAQFETVVLNDGVDFSDIDKLSNINENIDKQEETQEELQEIIQEEEEKKERESFFFQRNLHPLLQKQLPGQRKLQVPGLPWFLEMNGQVLMTTKSLNVTWALQFLPATNSVP